MTGVYRLPVPDDQLVILVNAVESAWIRAIGDVHDCEHEDPRPDDHVIESYRDEALVLGDLLGKLTEAAERRGEL